LSNIYFAPLPGTAEEARSIQSLFPEAEILTGRQATKASLRGVEAPAILHIATHGCFLDDPPGQPGGQPAKRGQIEDPLLRSGLALAGANRTKSGGDDGIFTALEASNLNLWGTKVVTLSACETGVGQVKNGEGVYGLRRAFFLAGAETLVMSMWAVSDRVTRETMAAYYTGLKQGLGRGEALRQAQLAMLKPPAPILLGQFHSIGRLDEFGRQMKPRRNILVVLQERSMIFVFFKSAHVKKVAASRFGAQMSSPKGTTKSPINVNGLWCRYPLMGRATQQHPTRVGGNRRRKRLI
jgi:hypothetical protein